HEQAVALRVHQVGRQVRAQQTCQGLGVAAAGKLERLLGDGERIFVVTLVLNRYSLNGLHDQSPRILVRVEAGLSDNLITVTTPAPTCYARRPLPRGGRSLHRPG